MIKAIWIIISLNTLALLILIGSYFFYNANKNPSYEEKGWTIVLSIIISVFILLAAIPLYFSKSKGVVIFSGFMAILPWLLALVFSMLK